MDGLEKYYEFSPSDQRLIDAYLRPKIAGNDDVGGGGCIHDADVTSDHPYDLVRKHAPARGTVTGDKGVWFFFSPARYAGSGGGKSKTRSGGSRLRNRARTVYGADGKKKGTWNTEGKKKTVPGTAGGYLQKLSYHEVAPSGSVVKPGWLMTEYAIEEDHHGGGSGGGAMVLCKVYRSPRCHGSDVSSSSRKRKADVVEQEQPAVEQLQRRWKPTHEEDMFVVDNLLREDMAATEYYAAAPACQETEHMLGSGESAAAPADQCTRKTDQMSNEGQPQIQEDARDELTRSWESLATGHDEVAIDYLLQEDQPVPPCAPQKEDEDDVTEISFEELFGGSSSLAGVVSPPCAAQPEDAAVSCAEMSEKKVVPADDGDEEGIEFTHEELMLMMGSSTRDGCSSMPSPRTLTEDEDDDDHDDMCGLACPPMDYAIMEAFVEHGPAILEDEDFICDF